MAVIDLDQSQPSTADTQDTDLLKVKTNTKIMILEYKQTILEQISRAPRELANMLKRNLEVYEPLLKGLDQAVMQLEEKILGLEEQLQGLEKIQC
ncbi:Protein STB2 [Frankliniella fusca]|uniref:Protein STB2 n=1 Tax=Frankliniella fusca TaxID=407009 RepID=A0AAE1HNR7_9NEOP|nr:Protein STB2 [Frankliniella fusca]